MSIVIKRVRFDKSKKEFIVSTSHDRKGSGIIDDLKNNKKLKLLIEKGIEISDYPEKMIKLLLDGDYKNELGQYKSKVLQLAHEILEKKVPITRLGVQTNLYKIVAKLKKQNQSGGKVTKQGQQRQGEKDDAFQKSIKLIQEYMNQGQRQEALNILVQNIPQTHPSYYKIYSYIIF